MYFSLEIDSNLPSMSEKEDVIKTLKSLIDLLSKEESTMGSIKDQYNNSIGVWQLLK